MALQHKFKNCCYFQFPSAVEGSGRLATLDTPVTLQEAVRAVKKHLKLSHVRLAMAIKDNMGKNDKLIIEQQL